MTHKLGSLFDGIGGWPLAATRYGIEPVWSSEIELFPVAVTDKHFPKMKQLGDITKINGAEIEPVDIITLGSPCQDLSIAGKRAGLDGARSGLFKKAIQIVKEMRSATNGIYPRFIVWENVPGAFSSNKGNDFRAVLEEITETEIPIPKAGHYNKNKEWCIGWANAGVVRSSSCEVAWRVLDAQYWGVPQRRKRIFLVADFRGQCAGEILFKPESVCGYPAESRGEGERIAGSIADSIGTASVLPFDTTQITSPQNGCKPKYGDPCHPLCATAHVPAIVWDMTHADEVMRPVKDGIVPTLNARMGTGGNQVPVIQEPIPINDKATRYKGGGETRNNDGAGNGLGIGKPGDPAPTMTAGDRHAVGYNYKVRRLTPTECERLQGLPDGYTLIDDKKCSDSARYKALGNGMAQPCADFVVRRIAEVQTGTGQACHSAAGEEKAIPL